MVIFKERCYAAFLNYMNRVENGIMDDEIGDWLAAEAVFNIA
ncbi:MAG: hypothetical protein QMC23_06070 [Rubritalea sp.]|jgi:hypothetical protein|tara:strand:+ start:3453 stop:3578 length:126 start_codon:yes stop_codon:yes gene_type:complete